MLSTCILALAFISKAQLGNLQNTELPAMQKSVLIGSQNTSPISNYTWQSDVNDAPDLTYSLPKQIKRQFTVDSPFGTLTGGQSASLKNHDSMTGTSQLKTNYRLMLCFTGIGLRIEL